MLHRTFGSSGCYDRAVQNSQKFRAGTKSAVSVLRVLWRRRAEVTEVLGTGMNVVNNSQKFRILWRGRAERTEVPGTGMRVLQNLQKFGIRVIPDPLGWRFDLK